MRSAKLWECAGPFVLTLFPMVHAGFAIERLPEEQAQEDLEAWEELQHALG